jgi:hypothetical protein
MSTSHLRRRAGFPHGRPACLRERQLSTTGEDSWEPSHWAHVRRLAPFHLASFWREPVENPRQLGGRLDHREVTGRDLGGLGV